MINPNTSNLPLPHTYVLFAYGGHEEEIIKILYHNGIIKPHRFNDRILPDEECIFIPKRVRHLRSHGVDREVAVPLYKSYLFLYTRYPTDFFFRLRKARLWMLGKSIFMLRTRGETYSVYDLMRVADEREKQAGGYYRDGGFISADDAPSAIGAQGIPDAPATTSEIPSDASEKQ